MKRLAARALLATLATIGTTGCWQSDAESFRRSWERDRQRRIRGMRAATAQTQRGTPAEGEALVTLVRDKTHESTYQSAPGGQPGPYVERSYFAPDGRFVYTNSVWARDMNGRDGSRWRVDGPRLCIVNVDMSQDEHCYTIAVTADRRVQYYVDEPGGQAHGLLTKIPTAVHDGPLPPP